MTTNVKAARELADNYVAWCKYRTRHERETTIHLCDSDDEGAFRVYHEKTVISLIADVQRLDTGWEPIVFDANGPITMGRDGLPTRQAWIAMDRFNEVKEERDQLRKENDELRKAIAK